MDINVERIEKAIVTEFLDNHLHTIDETVKLEVAKLVEKSFGPEVEATLHSYIEKIVSVGLEREYFKLDNYGRQVGEATSISKELERLLTGYWGEKVNRYNGKPTEGYGAVTRAEHFLSTMVSKDFSKEFQQTMVNGAAIMKDSFREELHNIVNRSLSEVFKVRTEYDKNKKGL